MDLERLLAIAAKPRTNATHARKGHAGRGRVSAVIQVDRQFKLLVRAVLADPKNWPKKNNPKAYQGRECEGLDGGGLV
jgi:hypothetical protein